MILIMHSWAHVLFDTSKFHSFISMLFARVLRLDYEGLDLVIYLDTLIRGFSEVFMICNFFCIVVDGCKLSMNLIVMPIGSYDVICDIDWLSNYRAMVNCYNKGVTLFPQNGKTNGYQESMS